MRDTVIYTFLMQNLLWTEGIALIGFLLCIALLAALFYPSFLYVVVLVFLGSLYFFRNPERTCIAAHYDPTILVCPADGTIVELVDDLSCKEYGCSKRISIFLSPLDVHVNWIPLSGTIEAVKYRSGTFYVAYLSKSSELNERNDIIICGIQGQKIVVRQIAGSIARRICCWVFAQDTVSTGQKYGMIRFGSRVDIFVPDTVLLSVGLGQHVYGGETILGRWS